MRAPEGLHRSISSGAARPLLRLQLNQEKHRKAIFFLLKTRPGSVAKPALDFFLAKGGSLLTRNFER